MKLCYTCNKEKPLEDFYAHPKTIDKRGTRCKACCKEIVRLNHLENPKEYKPRDTRAAKFLAAEKQKRYRKHYLKEYHKEYYRKNREKLIENSKRIYRERMEDS